MTRAVDRAVIIAGNQTALARLVGVSPQSVQQWVSLGYVPVQRCRAVAAATEGAVTRYELMDEIPERLPEATEARHG